MVRIRKQGTKCDDQSPVSRGTYRAGFAFGSLSFVAMSGLGVVSMIVTSRIYGVEIIGEFALVTAAVAALWLLSTVKEQEALIKEITALPPRHPRVSELFAAVLTFSTALTVLVAAVDAVVCWFALRGPLRSPDLVAPTLVSIAGYVVVTNTGWNIDSILSAFVAGRQIFLVRVHEVMSFLVIAVALGLMWRSVWGLVLATIGASLTSLLHRLAVVRPFARARLSWSQYRRGLAVLPELLRFGLKATPGQIAQGASAQGGVWAVGIVAPIAVVGAYGRAFTIPQRLQQASTRISDVLYPTLVGRHAAGDRSGFDRALIDSIRYEVLAMLLLAAVIGGSARSVLDLFGPGFAQASTALLLLALFPVLAAVTVTQTQALWAINRPGRTSMVAGVRLAVTITLLIVLTPTIGIVGPAIALLAGFVASVGLNGLVLRGTLSQPLRETWPLRERVALLVGYLAGLAAAHATEQLFPSVAALIVCAAVGTLAYGMFFALSGGVNERDRARLHELASWARSYRRRREPACVG